MADEATVKFKKPFPHTVIDNFISPSLVEQVNRDWPQEWLKEDGKGQRKWSTRDLPASARTIVDAIDVRGVEEATGIRELFIDRELFGGGLHCIPRGGFLKMHVDFNQHPKGWHRRVNMLVYLNEHWQDDWGGHLELGLRKTKKIAPLGGRCVIFETNDQTWHGHPEPLNCPGEVQRRSLALYFYTKQPPALAAHTTIYKKAA